MSEPGPAAWFAADGPLAAQIPGYAPRAVQQRMAERVAATLEASGRLLVEAGTGTGKTLAYLLPALASGRKVIVATATRHLQDQIHDKDVPQVRAALAKPMRVSLLKGRSNYLCLQRLERTEQTGRLPPAQYPALREVRAWAGRTRTGDINEIGDAADGSPLWPRVTSTADNCLGQDCPFFDDCWVVKARRGAQAADLVIANHHLLFADMALREEGFGEVLPGADAVILDEAHKLPETAGRFFGKTISGRQLRDLVRDGRAEADASGDMPALYAELDALAEAEAGFNDATAGAHASASVAWSQLSSQPRVVNALAQLDGALDTLHDVLQPLAGRSEALAAITERAASLLERARNLQTAAEDSVRWLERRGSGWLWHATPLDVAPVFTRALDAHKGAWVFTSATLSVGGKLDYFASRLGLEDAERLILDSPFDYQRNGLLYLPENMPDPGNADFAAAVADTARPLIAASGGGAFVLCTSYRGLHRCAQRLASAGVKPLLVQGEMGRGALLEQFRQHDDAVLIGTSSFWEGVDVRGRALRLVIIDRLPFASPSDPVLDARLRALKAQGGQPFVDYQLPQAVITLKQGVGRLIRDAADRGVLAICDPRLHRRGYGRVFIDSLPPMPVTHDADQVTRFLQSLAVA